MTEKEKYDRLWQLKKHHSFCATLLPLYLQRLGITGKILDIGCGDGTSVYIMRRFGMQAFGTDISFKGLRYDRKFFMECPLWDMPYDSDEFDVTVSTDVLEHLPEHMIEPSLDEILRVTKTKTIHFIETVPDEKYGMTMHMTTNEPIWWEVEFAKSNDKNVEVIVQHKNDLIGEMNAN